MHVGTMNNNLATMCNELVMI